MATVAPDIYESLRRLARRHFNHADGHTLQPTALVHEAFLKIAAADADRFADEAHFAAVAITAMRQIMVDHARARNAQKRGGSDQHRVTLSGVSDTDGTALVDLLALDAAISKLAALDERQSKAVELRYFAGLKVDEIAVALETSVATVERDLRKAKAWLRVALAE